MAREGRGEMKRPKTFRVGDWVYVRRSRKRVQVERLYTDIPGGVLLSEFVEGFRSWNMADLRPAPAPKVKLP